MTAQAVVWPNGLDDMAVRIDADGTETPINLADERDGNAVRSPKPARDHNIFRKIYVMEGAVPESSSHGRVRNTDVRAFHYAKGELQTNLLGIVPYRASYPRFKADSCAVRLRVNIAVANYCTHSKSLDDDDRADIWIGHLTDKFNDPDVVSGPTARRPKGFWPHVMVVRDLVNNPLPADCGEGYVIEVTPSSASIDEYLPVEGYWPANSDD